MIRAILDQYRLAALRRLARPLRVKINGNSYYLNPEPTALYHARQSMPKIARLVELVPDAKTVFDVGANCGIFAALCAKKFPAATIHAFEPTTALQPMLARNCTSPNIAVHQLAISDHNQDATLYIHPDSQQANSLQASAVEAFLDPARMQTETIHCATIDSFVAEHSVPPIDVLKVDVQGLEGAVLRGARNALDDVRYLFLEVTWLDLEGVQRILPAAEHYGFSHVAVINEVITGADLLFTREPLTTDLPKVWRFPLGPDSAGQPWF